MAQRIEIGNRAPVELARLGIQINLPSSPSNNLGGMYEKQIAVTSNGTIQKAV